MCAPACGSTVDEEVSNIAKEIEQVFGSDVVVKYIDILASPWEVAYQETMTEAFAGLIDLPVVYIDGERRLTGALTADLLISELTGMGITPKEEDN